MVGKQRYLALDALRGVAAVMVLVMHLSEAEATPVPSSYLAVDLFFMLSGFVLAHAYGDRLRSGLPVWRGFMVQRLRRLWPLYLLGTALGLGLYLWQAMEGWLSDPLGPVAGALLANAVFLPWPWPLESAPWFAFPFNIPSWSLFCEMAVNVVFAYLVVARRGPGLQLVLLAASALGLVAVSLLHHGLFVGNQAPTTLLGLVRASFGFFAGVLLYDWRGLFAGRGWSLPAPLGMGLFALLCFVPAAGLARAAFDLLAVMVLFPMLIALSSQAAPKGRLAAACAVLGVASYPLYVLHWPLMHLANVTMVKLNLGSLFERPKAMALVVGLSWAAAILLGYADEWLRKRAWGGGLRAGGGEALPATAQ